ncbi:MAG: protealysin inhibitor emfourin [Betaproteobacteria bacterium]
MRIALSVDGGVASFPGLRKPAVFDVDTLPAKEQAVFTAMVERACFFTCAEDPAVAPMPDARSYTVRIDDGSRRRTLRLHEPIANPALNALLQAVKRQAAALRSGGDKQ